jgi:hypothetical protein
MDQPLHLLYFESRSTHDTDADAQGTAGGLGVVKEEKEIEPVSWTERWDDRIRTTSIKVSFASSSVLCMEADPRMCCLNQVEAIAEAIQQKNLIPVPA